MAIAPGGNVGIGTTSPTDQFEINGNSGSTPGTIRMTTNRLSDPAIGIINLNSGNENYVSIGVGSGAAVFQTSASLINIKRGNSYTSNNDNAVNINQVGTSLLAIDTTTGNVGIGQSTPTEKLEVNGNVKATAFLYTSDRRLKTHIEPIESASDKICRLDGVSFDWANGSGRTYGFIAQDVEQVFPELVKTDAQGYRSVQYGNLVAPLVEAFKEQRRELASVKGEVDSLKRENQELRKELDEIKKLLGVLKTNAGKE
jgi:hypothetical protein